LIAAVGITRLGKKRSLSRLRADFPRTISADDHGFLYGDGVYDTLRYYRGQPFQWDAHWRRLSRSARAIGLKVPSPHKVRSVVQSVLRRAQRPNASVRITLSRGAGALGLDPALCATPTCVIHLHPDRDLEAWRQAGVSAGLVSIRHIPPESLDSRIKSTSLLNSVLAKAEAKKRGWFEGILLNLRGEITEGTTTNVFFVRGNVLYTPAEDCGLLPGITRGLVLRLAKKCRITCRVGRYTPNALTRADEIFLTNSSLEIVPVVRWNGRRVRRPGRITRLLQDQYQRAIMATLLHERVPS